MAAETADLRAITRRVKKLALEKAEQILLNPEDYPGLYQETLMKVLANAVPRTQEITGEDGEAINIKLVSYADNTGTLPAETIPS